MFKITVNTQNEQITREFENKILLSDALSLMGIVHHAPCGGMGICKKCSANVNGVTKLLCRTYAEGDTYIDYITESKNVQGITKGISFDYEKNPLVSSGYGAAIDIGTTTVAAYIYKFPECECVKQLAVLNPQAKHGADVISRIMYSNDGGIHNLKQEITDTIKELTKGYDIQKYVVTGNTVMLHMFTEKSTQGISVAPYTPETLFGMYYDNAYIPHCISSFVGADITCSILSANMKKHKKSLLADIGTNGEMALYSDGKYICCSTAAGPAFEGAGITCGMYASKGAISKVYLKENRICFDTIGNEIPTGICGSALIDAVAIMLKFGIIDETGFLEDDFYIPETDVYITQEDIRNIQLAKSAIRSGIDALINKSQTSFDDIETFYIAGGFGSYIDIKNAVTIGLIPKELEHKTVICGNGAGMGAAMILQRKEFIDECEIIANSSTVCDLATDGYFMEKYIDNMGFYND